MSPIAKNLQQCFDAEDGACPKGEVITKVAETPVASAEVMPAPALPAKMPAESEALAARVAPDEVAAAAPLPEPAHEPSDDDLFFAESKDFITREAQFQAKKAPAHKEDSESEFEDEGDEKAKPVRKPKAKAKSKAKSKPGPKAKAKAKAKAKGKRGLEPGTKAKKSPTGKAKAKAKSNKKPAPKMEDPEDEPSPVPEDPEASAPVAMEKVSKAEARPRGRKSGKQKATFARRYRPDSCVYAGKRWDCMRDCFDLLIRDHVTNASTVEATVLQLMPYALRVCMCDMGFEMPLKVSYWNYTMEMVKDNGNVDGTNIRAFCKKTAQSFLTLEQVQSAWSSFVLACSVEVRYVAIPARACF